MSVRTRTWFAVLALLAPSAVVAQDAIERKSTEPQTTEMTPAELEFQQMLSDAVLHGFFTANDAPADRPLQEDRYELRKVEKVPGLPGKWAFPCRIQYGGRDFTLPLVLDVVFAGDTPVITLTDFPIPGQGTFTARVLFYRGQYAGTWSSPKHGGHLFGTVEKLAAKDGEGSKEGAAKEGTARDGGEAAKAGGASEAEESSAPVEERTQLVSLATPFEENTRWPCFRGADHLGLGEGELPTTWNVEEGEGVVFRTALPGLCHSSPIVWDDVMFVTSVIAANAEDAPLKVGLYGSIDSVPDEGEQEFVLFCLDRSSGDTLWETVLYAGEPVFPRHPKGSHAASTPATDGEHIVVFLGSEGLYCLDKEGEIRWQKDFGKLDSCYYVMPETSKWGWAASPTIHDGRVYVQVDHNGDDFVACFDAESGEEVWRTPREEVPTYCTPTVDVREGRRQLLVNGFHQIAGFDLDSGALLWEVEGAGDIPVPTPIVAHGLAFFTNAHAGAGTFVVDALAKGRLSREVSEEHPGMVWSDLRGGIYMQTPLVVGDELYLCADQGILRCVDARTGKEHYRNRLSERPDGFTASGVAGDGKLYFTSEEGRVHVVKAGPKYELLSVNELGETCMATPAISHGQLLFRTRHHVVCVGGDRAGE